jgi:hypothetical protein
MRRLQTQAARHAPLIQGDFRSLYIAWLPPIALEEGGPDNDETLELPPLPGLNKLDFGLFALAEFFAVDSNLIVAAAGSALWQNPSPLLLPFPA